ncbi:MAG: hypothetical protein UR66_C0010G0028 [Candidatus Moranbacteria bacterium GW2011_GWE1_35_17]|nr:MAG: hypothetical protein UR66_C0010G0028 [Candidatus Moranbacteria bacterium GW2011_GWE1_35_17]KKP67847.1 MAG: hypothetical protein UR65_C0065G0013 [Candidatus Moranbacteria bacterium GW2011_GWE2_35_164]KKP83676.1 MAG: hypothetical protein UR82_C0019G0004 [Candidatus Moranbacteria bacterium GW2011_GWF1_35_5]KKP83925.1 MAG: hypothetical protein UR83_C0030G0009 [Candidatus Moranbacteria bacterium GW2011_GWF2_35_54]
MNKEDNNKSEIIKKIVARSGNNFHYQVVNFLRELGWSVLVSPYYTDNLTDKPREIDIIAEKAFDVNTWGSSQWMGTLNVRLFIECKYINNNNVFWFDVIDKQSVISRVMSDTPLKSPKENTNIEKHHYMKVEKVAKLFSSDNGNRENSEVFYKAINQNLNALIYYKNKGSLSIIPKSGKTINVISTLNYPLIVCNSFENIFGIDVVTNDEPTGVQDNFQLEVNYAYLNNINGNQSAISEYFLLDVVDFRKFDNFLAMIEESDIKTIKEVIAFSRQ